MRILICLTGLLALIGPASATSGMASLNDVLEAAWEEDHEWRAARNTLEADQQRVVQGRANLLPRLDAQYSIMENSREDGTTGITQEFTERTGSLRFAQPLFSPSAWYQYRQAASAGSASEAQFQQARQDFLLRVARHYLDVLRAGDNLGAARAQERAISRQLEQTRESFEVGMVSVTDVHEAEAAHDLARVEVIAAEAEFEIARDRLEAFSGRRWEQLAGLREEMPLEPPDPREPEAWVKMTREHNPMVVTAMHQRDGARYESNERFSAQLPEVNLVGQYQDTRLDGEPGAIAFRESESYAYGVEISMPLFAGGALNSRRKESALRAETATDEFQRAWRDAGQQALALHRRVNADVQRVNARRQSIRSAESALRATESGYEVGTRNIVDVLNAQQNLFSTRRDFANARYDYILNSLELRATAGALEERDLELVNEWLSLDEPVELYQ